MGTLLLLRHAKSGWDDPSLEDFDRPLSQRGRRAAQRLAGHVADRGIIPGLVLCSPARRTRETLEPILAGLRPAPPVRLERNLYLASADAILERIRAVTETAACLLVIGHNPGLHELASALAGAGDARLRARLADKLPTGGLITLTLDAPWSKLVPGAGRLVAFVTPRDLGGEED